MTTPVHEYVSTKRDCLDAQRLHRKNRPWAAFWYYFWYVGLPALCAAYLAYFAWQWQASPKRPQPLSGAFGGMALYLLLIVPLARWLQIRRLWNAAQPKKYRGQPVTLQFDDELISSARPGESEGRFYWKAIEDYAEDEKLALLYVRRKLFLFVPKRAMDEAEWERLRAIGLTRKALR